MLDLLSSVNKGALFVFIIVVLFILYELYQLLKHKKESNVLVIPDFSYQDAHVDFTPLKINTGNASVKPSSLPFHMIALGFLLVLLLVVFAFLLVTSGSNENPYSNKQTRIVTSVESQGVYLYDTTWTELGEDSIVSQGEYIFIGLKTIPGVVTDKARIRVNQDFWSTDDETQQYNADHAVYYIQYYVPQDGVQLNIDAQLHTEKNAWLSESL